MKKLLFTFLATIFIVVNYSFVHAQSGGAPMKIMSPAFEPNQNIPKKYTCQGEDINPELRMTDIPPATKTLALIVDDPDAPGKTWVHWVVFNIPATKAIIQEKSIPGQQGWNDFGKYDYGGPCPPSGIHHYFFKIYALDTAIANQETMTKKDLENAMKGHILAEAQLVGLYGKM